MWGLGCGWILIFDGVSGIGVLANILTSRNIEEIIIYPKDHGTPVIRGFGRVRNVAYCPIASRHDTKFITVNVTLNGPSPYPSPMTIYIASNSTLLGLCPTIYRTFCRGLPIVIVSTSEPRA